VEIFAASNQWATRPADQRFGSLQAMYDATRHYAEHAREATVAGDVLRVEGVDGDLRVIGKAGVPATITHYALGQLAQRAGAPASYLRELPSTLAASNLNYGLARAEQSNVQLLFHSNGKLVLRAATSERYSRIWNYEVVERLIDVADRNALIPGMQTFAWGGGELPPVAERDKALYASDHDMFAFLMSEQTTVTDPVGQTLRRGIIVSNSEVGAASLRFTGFYFRDVCCNHIIWGAQDVAEVRLVHTGDIQGKLAGALVECRKYLNGSGSLDEAAFESARVQIAGDKDAVLDKLFGIRSLGLTRKVLAASYDAVVPEQDGDPRTVWGMAQGITRHSQATPFADERNALDRAAGRLLAKQIAF
jgi:hypothetical protein